MPASVLINPPSLEVITVLSPFPGSEFSHTVPNSTVWLIHSIHASFQAIGGAGARTPHINITDGTNDIYHFIVPSVVATGETYSLVWAPNLAFFNDKTLDIQTSPMPPTIYLPAGFIISSETHDIAINDRWSQIFIYISPFILPKDRG